jgi:hypothetical protein
MSQDTVKVLEESEVLALLFPEQGGSGGKPSGPVLAVLQDAQGGLALHHVVADSKLLRRARVAVRYKSGTPIVDPHSREVIGYELDPIAVA